MKIPEKLKSIPMKGIKSFRSIYKTIKKCKTKTRRSIPVVQNQSLVIKQQRQQEEILQQRSQNDEKIEVMNQKNDEIFEVKIRLSHTIAPQLTSVQEMLQDNYNKMVLLQVTCILLVTTVAIILTGQETHVFAVVAAVLAVSMYTIPRISKDEYKNINVIKKKNYRRNLFSKTMQKKKSFLEKHSLA